MFKKPKNVTQEYIWVAEYEDGFLYEFEDDETENSFYSIDKDRLLRFGLAGEGEMYFDIDNGIFNIFGDKYELLYKVGDMVIPLTNRDSRDIITYKKAYAEASLTKRSGEFTNRIVAYYFGYKSEFEVGEIVFNFKPIFCKPVGGGVYLDLYIVSSVDLDGELIIIKNGSVIEKIDAPLSKDVAGGMKWVVK